MRTYRYYLDRFRFGRITQTFFVVRLAVKRNANKSVKFKTVALRHLNGVSAESRDTFDRCQSKKRDIGVFSGGFFIDNL